VVNFDTLRTSVRNLEDYYYRYGRIRRVEIKRNYAFVEFDTWVVGVHCGVGG